MKIPENLKIGGKTYVVELTDSLYLGSGNVSAEILYSDLIIHINPNQAQAKIEADFLHEMLHVIMDHLGYKEHDEKRIDELAQALHMVIIDNPDVFKHK